MILSMLCNDPPGLVFFLSTSVYFYLIKDQRYEEYSKAKEKESETKFLGKSV